MTGLVITQAALHAALLRVRDDGTYGSLDTLLTLLDPAHAAGFSATGLHTFHAPSLAAEEAQPAHHDHLPAGPEEVAPAASDTPAVTRAEHARSGPSVEQAAEGRRGREPTVFTPERDTELRRLWPTEATMSQIHAALNRCPGPPIKNPTSIYSAAKRLCLPSPRAESGRKASPKITGAPPAISPHTGKPLAERYQVEQTPRESDAAEVVVVRPGHLPPEDLDDGDARIREGWNPPKLSDWLGCTIAEAETWCRTLREADAVAAPAEGVPA